MLTGAARPDVEIVSADDLPQAWAGAFDPRLATVARPSYELGCKAAEVLVDLLRPSATPVARVVLQHRLRVCEPSAGRAWNRAAAE